MLKSAQYMITTETEETVKQVFASQHGLENNWSGKLKANEGEVKPGSFLFKDAAGLIKVYRQGISTAANNSTKNITMTAGHETRFRVGDTICECTSSYGSGAILGVIDSINTTTHVIHIASGTISITGGGYIYVGNADDSAVVPTIIGISLLTGDASEYGETARKAPIVWVRHCYVITGCLEFYTADTDVVITKAQTDLQGRFDILPESIWVA